MLSRTGIQRDLVHDEETYKMIDRGVRGGMTQVSVRKVEANNKYMTDSYHKEKEPSYILYLDAINLYGLAMVMKLPYTKIKFIQHTDINEEDILSYDNNEQGYFLDVDLEYLKELHDNGLHLRALLFAE